MSNLRPKVTSPKPTLKTPQAPKIKPPTASRATKLAAPTTAQKVSTPQKVTMAAANRVTARKAQSVARLNGPSLTEKRRMVERKAEMAVRNKLYRLGYQSVRRMQHNGLHGVDLGAFKYDKQGKLVGGAVVEVKGGSTRTPSVSSFRTQVRRSYFEPRLLKAHNAGVQGAMQLYRLSKRGKLDSLGGTYGLQDKGKGPRLYHVPRRGPISPQWI